MIYTLYTLLYPHTIPRHMGSTLKWRKILLFIGDFAVLVFSLWLTLLIRYGTEAHWMAHLFPFVVVYIIWLVIFYIDDLYEIEFEKKNFEILNSLIRTLSIGAIIAAAFFYFGYNRFFSIRPQRVLIINVLIAFLLLIAWRFFFLSFIKSQRLSKNVLIIGEGTRVREVIQKILSKPQLGFTVKALLKTHPADISLPESIFIFHEKNHLYKICKTHQIAIIIFEDRLKQDNELLKNLLSCLPLNISFFELSTFYENITGKIPLDSIEHLWFLENFREGSKKHYERIKRIIDILFSSVLLVITLPLLPLIIFAIKIDSPGPFLFKQIRVGKNKKKFLAMKFRTMVPHAEKSGPQWATKNDPRVTRVGRFLRKTRIDEIPQLINILRGEMSLIGPRPERPEFIEELKKRIPFYEERLLIKPGLTGWAQVMGPAYGGSFEESLEKVQYDLFYIKNRSLGLDISIVLKTIKTILSRQGV